MSQITFYFQPLSGPSRAAFAVILIGKVEADCRVVQLGQDTKLPEYLAINPFGQVPSLLHNNIPMFESMAIIRYLARTQPGCKKLYPEDDALKCVKVDMYMDWHHSGFRAPASEYFTNAFGYKLKGKQAPPEAEVAKSKEELITSLNNIEKVFLGGEYKFKFLNGNDQMTCADIICATELSQLFMLNFDYSKWPNITNFLYILFSDPDVRKASEFLLAQVQKNIPEPNEIIKKILGH